MRLITFTLALLLLVPLAIRAETAYVTDRLYVSIRDGQDPQSAVVKSIVSGSEVEVLQRQDGFAQVREPAGAEGWIAERYLVATAPAGATLNASNAELKQAQAELASVRKQLAEAQKTAGNESRRARALEQKLKGMEQVVSSIDASGDSENPVEPVTSSGDGEDGVSTQAGFAFHWLWILIAFAMLVAGFVSGAIWLLSHRPNEYRC